MADHRLTFLPSHQSATFEEGINVRDAALELGIVIESTCAGIGSCAKCKVQVHGGVSAPSGVELELLTPQELAKGVRLSCQARLVGDSVCVIPEESLVRSVQILSEGQKGRFPLAPDIRKISLHLPEPQLGEKYFDYEQLLRHLGLKHTTHLPAARALPGLLRSHDFHITATVEGDELVTIEGGDTSGVFLGAAIDIGTTTVVVKLVDLRTGHALAVASALNAQRPYGADVVGRIHYTMEHAGGLELLRRLLVRQINELITEACHSAGVPGDSIYKLTAVGNTVMQHILLGIDPRTVAMMPYTPAFQGPATVAARDLGISIHPDGLLFVLPNLASFVGSDITSVLTVLNLDEQDDVQLVVDIGTKGEMVLGSRRRMVCGSSPAGPAWEGATITWGMRAARGAIERAGILNGELEVRTIGNVRPIGICGSGLLDLVSEFLRAGIISRSGRILSPTELDPSVPAGLRDRLIPLESGAYDICVTRLEGGEMLTLTQKDIREVQLAKGAIAAGIHMLMRELKVEPGDIAAVHVAGAFGNHVRGQDAVAVGLIPDIPAERIRFVGNAALSGAEAVLLSADARRKAESLAQKVGYVEISGKPEFQDVFVDAMQFKIGA